MLGGKARVGKTTAANILKIIAESLDMDPVVLPFAKAIKDEATKKGLSKDLNAEEYRAFCQELGATKRSKDPDYWVNKFNKTFEKIAKEENKNLEDDRKKYKEKVIIVDDCRYLNEINYGRSIGAKQVFISHGKRELEDHNGEWRNHESEVMGNLVESGNKDYDSLFEFKITNEGNMDSFLDSLSQLAMLLFSVVAESLVLCNCEVCLAARQGRPVKEDILLKEIEEMIEDIYKKEQE